MRAYIGGGATVRRGAARFTVLASYQAGTEGQEHVIVGLRSGSATLRVLTKHAVFRETGGIERLPVGSRAARAG